MIETITTPILPDVSIAIRYSEKAKFLQLRATASYIELIIPKKNTLSTRDIQNFLHIKHEWIAKQWLNVKEKLQACTDILPATINLPAIKQHWQVRYISQQHKKIKWLTNLNYDLILIGNIQDKKICLSILQSWLKSHASHYLTLELEALRHHTNLSYTSVIIRNNKTRWGSCSSQGKISLSSKLLFLPYALMRHVLLHELCHLKYLNHGQKFWQLLQSYDDKSAEHIQQLKKIKIPIWVENKL